MLDVGDVAPEFDQLDQSGERLVLSELLHDGELILYFYPADFTPVCTAEACLFRDNFDELEDVGVRVVGVSPQDSESHQKFTDTFELPFSLLPDVDKQLIKAFGVTGPLGLGVRRVTFLIGQDAIIRSRSVADVFLGNHNDLINEVLGEA